MRRSPKNVKIAWNHKGLTHYGGVVFFHEFIQVLQWRRFASWNLDYPRPHHRYSLPQMLLALVYPIILGLDRLETSALLQANGTFQYLTGLPSYPDPQSLRRFLLKAPPEFRQQLHRFNDRLLRRFIHQPEHRSRLILDLDSTVVTVFGRQEGAGVGYNPRYRGKRSYDPLLCLEANSSFLWDTELRPGNAGTWAGSEELLASSFLSIPADIREVRVRADAGFGFHPVLAVLEQRSSQYAVVARLTTALKMAIPHLNQTAAPIVLAARRTDSPPKPAYLALARSARRARMDGAYSMPTLQTQTVGRIGALLCKFINCCTNRRIKCVFSAIFHRNWRFTRRIQVLMAGCLRSRQTSNRSP